MFLFSLSINRSVLEEGFDWHGSPHKVIFVHVNLVLNVRYEIHKGRITSP